MPRRSYLSAARTPSLSLRRRVCHPNTRTHVRLLGPCFKTGRRKPFRQPRSPQGQPTRDRSYPRRVYPQQYATLTHALASERLQAHNTGSIRFPFSSFRHSLTLFSKFFASFPHGTCSLSVSRQYLALDEIYHPFCTALPSNATLRKPPVLCRKPSRRRDSHPL